VDDLCVGVLGYGLRNSLAGHAHRPGAGSAIIAVCDPRPERLAEARERYGDGLLLVADEDELLGAKLDVVFVLSPDYLHERHAIAVMEAGAAAYVEKADGGHDRGGAAVDIPVPA
jgi:predicted dehydrogenase